MVTSTAMAEIAGSMDPTMNGRLSAAFSVDLLLNDPYFMGSAQSQVVTTAGGTIANLGEGVAGEGFASAVNTFTVTISQANTVTNNTAGVSVTHNGAGVVSWPVTIDILRYTAVDNVGNNVVGGLSHIGSRMWMCLLSGLNSISVSAGTALFIWCPPYI
jgi:phage-related protein